MGAESKYLVRRWPEVFHGARPGLAARPSGAANVWPVAAEADGLEVPAPEDEARFWALIEAAWTPLGPEVRQARQVLVIRPAGSPADTSVVSGALRVFLDILAGRCRGLTAAELTCLDRVAERKPWKINRAGIFAVTGGSDDGFLYARGFIVAMGRGVLRRGRR